MQSSDETKPCPLCGHENPAAQIHCAVCKRELQPLATSPVPAGEIITRQMPRPDIEALQQQAADQQQAAAQPQAAVDQRPQMVLELLGRSDRRFIIRDGDTVGRRDDRSGTHAEVLIDDVPEMGKISRRHARFFQRSGAWYVQHIGRVNFIIVDGQRRDDDRPVPIREGSIVNLALTPFKVTFNLQAQPSQQWWDD